MHYSEVLRFLRKGHKLTQNALSDALGMERSRYAYYETGRSKPDLSVLIKLSKIYNIQINDLALMFEKGITDYLEFHQTKEADPDSVAEKSFSVENLSDEEKLIIIYLRNSNNPQEFFDKVKKLYNENL